MSSEDPAARAAALFRNQNTRVSDIVSDLSVVQFFTPQNPEATMFFTRHLPEILDICLSSEDQDLSSKVFVLFPKINPSLVDGERFNACFLTKANKLLAKPIECDSVLGRFCSIAIYSVLNFPKKCAALSPVIFELLNYISRPGCHEMFQQICEYEAQSIEFLKILEKEEFGAKVLDILRNTTDDETIGQLLRIVRISVDNSILKKSFRKPEFCECILKFMNNENLFVKTQFWKCITNITDENTCKITKIALTQALANVGESYTKVDVFRIFSFDFIGKLLFFDHSIVNILQEKQINEIVLRVICQFRDCTHLILSVFKYVRTSFGIPQMNDWNYKVFVPFMMATAKTSDRNTATASCYQMLCDLLTVSSKDKKMRKMLQNVHGWQSFSSNYLIPYIKLRDTNYGGPIIRKYDGLPLFLD